MHANWLGKAMVKWVTDAHCSRWLLAGFMLGILAIQPVRADSFDLLEDMAAWPPSDPQQPLTAWQARATEPAQQQLLALRKLLLRPDLTALNRADDILRQSGWDLLPAGLLRDHLMLLRLHWTLEARQAGVSRRLVAFVLLDTLDRSRAMPVPPGQVILLLLDELASAAALEVFLAEDTVLATRLLEGIGVDHPALARAVLLRQWMDSGPLIGSATGNRQEVWIPSWLIGPFTSHVWHRLISPAAAPVAQMQGLEAVRLLSLSWQSLVAGNPALAIKANSLSGYDGEYVQSIGSGRRTASRQLTSSLNELMVSLQYRLDDSGGHAQDAVPGSGEQALSGLIQQPALADRVEAMKRSYHLLQRVRLLSDHEAARSLPLSGELAWLQQQLQWQQAQGQQQLWLLLQQLGQRQLAAIRRYQQASAIVLIPWR